MDTEQLENSPVQSEDENDNTEEIRQFSKEYSAEERSAAARDILEKRRAYFERKNGTSAYIAELTSQAETKKMSAEEAAMEISAVQTTIASLRTSKIDRVLHFFELKKMQRDLGIREKDSETLLEEYGSLSNQLLEAQILLQDKSELDAARERLTAFYAGQEEEWKEYLEDERVRDVRTVMQEHDAVFIHGFSGKVPSGNSPLFQATDWKTKLKILLALEPTISTSTIKDGDTDQNMWARNGVILNGGRVNSARRSDAGTIAHGLRKREDLGPKQDIKTEIADAVENRPINDIFGHNELVVEDPQAVGLYYEEEGKNKFETTSLAEMKDVAQELKMPLYIIRKGKIFRSTIDSENTSGEESEVTIQEILGSPPAVSEEQKSKLLAEVMDDSPFAIESPEMKFVESRADGRAQYIIANWENNRALFRTQKEDIRMDYQQAGQKIDAPVDVISNISGAYSKRIYFEKDGRLMASSVDKNFASESGKLEQSYYNVRMSPTEYIKIGGTTTKLGRPIVTNEDYLAGAREKIELLKNEAAREESPNGKKDYEEWLGALSFHLRGYAEEATQHGDTETARQAEALATQSVSRETYEEILHRRVGPNGEFRITQEDIA